jgi:hypothetical protein
METGLLINAPLDVWAPVIVLTNQEQPCYLPGLVVWKAELLSLSLKKEKQQQQQQKTNHEEENYLVIAVSPGK